MRKSDVIIVLKKPSSDRRWGSDWWIIKGEELEKWLKDGSIIESDMIIIPKGAYIARKVARLKIEKFDIKELVEG